MIDYIIGIIALNKKFLVEQICEVGGNLHGERFLINPMELHIVDPDESFNMLPVFEINFENSHIRSQTLNDDKELLYDLKDLRLEELIKIYKIITR